MGSIFATMDKLIAQLDAVGLEFTAEDLGAGAKVILEAAQGACPVDTGNLRDSGHLEYGTGDVWIFFDAPYASYVEFGTYKSPAQPFLRPALDFFQDEALSAIVDSVQSHFRDITK